MRGLRVGAAFAVFSAAAVFATTGWWPWRRMAMPAEAPAAAPAVTPAATDAAVPVE